MFKTFNLIISFILLSTNLQAQFPKMVASKEKAVFKIETFTAFGLQDASGTGFFIDDDGTAITALHVLEDARFAFIIDNDGNKYPIEKIIGLNEEADMLKFKVNSNGTKTSFLTIAAKTPAKGSDLFTISNPEGYPNAVSKGILSGILSTRGIDVIQTTAPISSGSSGGPLMDAKGRVIGVLSYIEPEGQNLNFAYSIDCLKMLVRPDEGDKISIFGKSLYILNQGSEYEPKLTLHTMEQTDSTTRFNFSFSNFSIAFADGGFIYANVKDSVEAMFILDPSTGKKIYAIATTLGTSIDDPTLLDIGETVYFSIDFPSIGSLKKFDIDEGMKGGYWKFNNINIPDVPVCNYSELDRSYQDAYASIIRQFNREAFSFALNEIKDLEDREGPNEKLHLMAAAASHALGKHDDAMNALLSAVQMRPNYAEYHADMSFLNMKVDKTSEALVNINNAIKVNSEYAEFFHMRAEIFFQLQQWKNVVDDLTTFINAGRKMNSYGYMILGEAKAKIKDDTACADFAKAKELAESDREWEKVNLKSRFYCK
jgi:serine protease Do